MLGVVLIYVGVVLILNGIGRLCNVDAKSSAVFNVFTGLLSFILNIVAVLTCVCEILKKQATYPLGILIFLNTGYITEEHFGI